MSVALVSSLRGKKLLMALNPSYDLKFHIKYSSLDYFCFGYLALKCADISVYKIFALNSSVFNANILRNCRKLSNCSSSLGNKVSLAAETHVG